MKVEVLHILTCYDRINKIKINHLIYTFVYYLYKSLTDLCRTSTFQMHKVRNVVKGFNLNSSSHFVYQDGTHLSGKALSFSASLDYSGTFLDLSSRRISH